MQALPGQALCRASLFPIRGSGGTPHPAHLPSASGENSSLVHWLILQTVTCTRHARWPMSQWRLAAMSPTWALAAWSLDLAGDVELSC